MKISLYSSTVCLSSSNFNNNLTELSNTNTYIFIKQLQEDYKLSLHTPLVIVLILQSSPDIRMVRTAIITQYAPTPNMKRVRFSLTFHIYLLKLCDCPATHQTYKKTYSVTHYFTCILYNNTTIVIDDYRCFFSLPIISQSCNNRNTWKKFISSRQLQRPVSQFSFQILPP